MENMENLRKENAQLKRVLAMCMNMALIKRLSEAIERINKGNYITEEEFFKDSPQEDA